VDNRRYQSGLRINFFRDFGLVIRPDRTRGRRIYAIGNRESAVYLSGVDTRRVILIFAISGSYSALYGMLLAGCSTQAYQAMDDLYLLPATTALALGGTRMLDASGTFLRYEILGVILITLLQSILSVVPRLAEKSICGIVIIAMLLLYGRERSWTLGGGRALPETDWWV
jgi:ribose transport system permease protein